MFGPLLYGRGPARKLIALPSARYEAKVPPIAPATCALLNVMVEVVKESVPVAEKYPLMESARAAILPVTKIERINKRFSIV